MADYKSALIDRVRAVLRSDLATAQRVARETAEAANHPEARPENDKDTRKIELSYLAAGQAARAQELEAALAALGAVALRRFSDDDAIEPGALVDLAVDGKARRVFLLPAAGGTKIKESDREVAVVTPEAPLGRLLLGKVVGESFELVVGGKRSEIEIERVA